MATSIINQDGSLSVALTTDEQDTLSMLPAGQLDAYITLWLEERARTVFRDRFTKLTDQEKAQVMGTLKKA